MCLSEDCSNEHAWNNIDTTDFYKYQMVRLFLKVCLSLAVWFDHSVFIPLAAEFWASTRRSVRKGEVGLPSGSLRMCMWNAAVHCTLSEYLKSNPANRLKLLKNRKLTDNWLSACDQRTDGEWTGRCLIIWNFYYSVEDSVKLPPWKNLLSCFTFC